MINKIVHFSDLHIRLYKDHELFKKILTEAFREWSELKPDRIVFTGDLVHSKNQMTPELVEFIVWVLEECAKISKTIVIIGNHDFLETNMDRLDAITPIVDSIKNPKISYLKERGVYADENVNWCVYSLMQHNIPPDIPKKNEGTINIGLFHGAIQGLKTDLGYVIEDGFDSNIFSGCDIVFCGDIHKRQTIYLDNEVGKKIPIIQIGSFLQNNFGESISNHGYGVYTVDNDDYQFVDLQNPNPYLSFKITSYDDIKNDNEILTNK
jgi:DNA repair exonuclease SbcCD nuclease subunit